MVNRDYFCRACNKLLYEEPILTLENSPQSAQGFLEESELEKDGAVDIAIMQCQGCGIVQHLLDPVKYYREVIRAVGFSNEMRQFRLVQLKDWLEKHKIKRKRIIEIGSGGGEYLRLLKDAGAEKLFGIEYSKANVKSCVNDGFNVFRGYLGDEFSMPDNEKFVAFAIFSFLEHWPDPNSSLANLNEILEEGAVGLIEVPNFEMILEKGLLCEFTLDHIFYFESDTISRLLELNGFEVKNIKKIWNEYILSIEVVKRSKLNVQIFKDTQVRLVTEISNFLDRCKGKGQIAVWGAGHQALAVITLSDIYKRIDFIIDSATFKQYKYTPATHLKIFPPEYLNKIELDGIIIMAAGYSSEIYSTLTSQFVNLKNIAILREDHLQVMK